MKIILELPSGVLIAFRSEADFSKWRGARREEYKGASLKEVKDEVKIYKLRRK